MPVCPHCGTELVYRDRVRRHYRKEGGDKVWFLLRRLKCPHCGSLHRELPDLLAPYKHYLVEIISGVLDGIVKPDDEDTEDYPCEQTMERWRNWLELNRSYIEGYLRSVGYRLLGFGEELKLFWLYRVYRCPSPKAREKYGDGLLHDTDRTYLAWKENDEWQNIELKEIVPDKSNSIAENNEFWSIEFLPIIEQLITGNEAAEND